jgi:simple sugar transport system permease protein
MTAVTVPGSRALRDAATTVGAVAVGMVLLTLFLLLAGFDAAAALGALARGSVGSWSVLTSVTPVRAVPLILLGLAFGLASQGGALNIGMEGQFAVGAIAATWMGGAVAGLPAAAAVPLVLASGIAGGVAWMAMPVVLRLRFGVTEVISTLLLNFVADAAISWAVTGPLQEPTRVYPQSAPLPESARLPHLLPGSRLHLGLVLALVVAWILWLALRRTAWGFRVRAVGAGPRAAVVSGGVSAPRVVATVLLLSGALAGMGGAIEVSGVSFALYQNLSPGYGFTAIAVALLGRLKPAGIVIAGLLFGALEAGAGAMQRDAGIPSVAVQVVEATVILTMVVAARRRS